MNEISQLSPVSDAEAARMTSQGTLGDLAAQITAVPVLPADRAHRRAAAGRRSPGRRYLLFGAPLAAGVTAAAVVIAMSVGGATQPERPSSTAGPTGSGASSPSIAQALSFVKHGGSLTVIVRNPLADPSVYQAEFAQHHLDITLRLVPVSPSIVDTVVYIGESAGASEITPITAQGCVAPSGGDTCSVGVTIPANFHGSANVTFGRAARPGERYVSAGSVFAPGEAMHGMSIQGETVAQVLAQLRARHVTAVMNDGAVDPGAAQPVPQSQVPSTWYVNDAVPWAPGQVMLFVGPSTHPTYRAGVPVKATASPSAAG